jgi:periplasmic divalent cation tolerance protein
MVGDLMDYISIYTTLPDEDIARKVAYKLVEERLVACVNFFPIKSVYRWKGNVEEEEEYAILMKSRRSIYHRVENRLKELHPYEVPAIVSYKIEDGLDKYLSWIEDETGGKDE